MSQSLCPKNCSNCEQGSVCLKCVTGFILNSDKTCSIDTKTYEPLANQGYWQILGLVVYVCIFLILVLVILMHRWAKFRYGSRNDEVQDEFQSELKILNDKLTKSYTINKTSATVKAPDMSHSSAPSTSNFKIEEISDSFELSDSNRHNLNHSPLHVGFKVKHNISKDL